MNLRKEADFLDNVLKQHKALKVLDIACGVGRHSIALAKLGYDVTGIDYSKYQIDYARKKARQERASCKFLIKNANNFLLNYRFDAAFCMWSTLLEEPMKYGDVIGNVFKYLKKGGIFIVDNRFLENKKEDKTFRKTVTRGRDRIKIFIHTKFTENFRVQNIVYDVNGKKISDICITHLLEEKELRGAFKRVGFNEIKVYYDYKRKKTENPDRIQFVAVKW